MLNCSPSNILKECQHLFPALRIIPCAQLLLSANSNNSRLSRFALTRHLRRDEVIYPLHEIGKFRGEPVYPRANVQRLKAAEGWMREGRMISMGQQPLKRVKARATTIERKRMLEMAKSDDQEDQQGLYAKWQTEPHVPEPVIDVRALPFCAIVADTPYPRGEFQRTISATSICMCRVCSPEEQSTCPVSIYRSNFSTRLSVLNTAVPGVGKIAKEFAMDFAEAVVRNATSLKHPFLTAVPGWIRI